MLTSQHRREHRGTSSSRPLFLEDIPFALLAGALLAVLLTTGILMFALPD